MARSRCVARFIHGKSVMMLALQPGLPPVSLSLKTIYKLQTNLLVIQTTQTVKQFAPWATWEVEQVSLNVDVSVRFSQFGGDVF